MSTIFSSIFGAPAENTQKLVDVLKANPTLEVEHKGDSNTMDYRVVSKIKDNSGQLSLWHDIKLYPTSDAKEHNIVNMVNEV